MQWFKHQHDDHQLAVQHPPFAAMVGTPATIVLLRCRKCKRLDTQLLTGRWTLTQVRGYPDQDEIQRLETDLDIDIALRGPIT